MARASRILDVAIIVLLTVVVLAHWGGRLPAYAQVKRTFWNLVGQPPVPALAADPKTDSGDAAATQPKRNPRLPGRDTRYSGRMIVRPPVCGTHGPYCR